jgi:hypothetical protein
MILIWAFLVFLNKYLKIKYKLIKTFKDVKSAKRSLEIDKNKFHKLSNTNLIFKDFEEELFKDTSI